ncbi:hypothetical protein [Micromonospora violae]|uniref:hypothetical protein n=1 Tax=Micromonospora violae TaxID=1278207 RepID=UPI00102CCD00|nr:hypothetical protein [Micromonospora violae]
MLPVAFTCPLWWVARWATRVLTSLAVVAALALGAGPATAATSTPGPVPQSSMVPQSSARPAPVAAGPLAATVRHAAPSAPTATNAGRAPGVGGADATGSWAHGAARPAPAKAAGESAPTWSVDTPVTLPGDQRTIAVRVPSVRAAESDRLPLADGASGRASRAPPGR